MNDELEAEWAAKNILSKYWKSPEQGAVTTVWAAVGKEWKARVESIWTTVQLPGRMIQARETTHWATLLGLMIGMVRLGCGLLL